MLYRIVLATLVARASTGKVDEMIRACKQDRNYMLQCPYLLCLFTHSSKRCTPV
jgi:hypothetical protein